MNIAILVADARVRADIKRLLSCFCGDDIKISTATNADFLVSDQTEILFKCLAAGKCACQVLYTKEHIPIRKNVSSEQIGQLRIYAFDDSGYRHAYPNIVSLIAYFAALTLPLTQVNY